MSASATKGNNIKKAKEKTVKKHAVSKSEQNLQLLLKSELDDTKEKELEDAIAKCKSDGLSAKSSEILAKAERELSIIKAREKKFLKQLPWMGAGENSLSEGFMVERMALHGLMCQSAGSLESTINKAKSVKHRGKLDADIDDAQRRLQHLQMGDQLKEPVLNMDKKLWEEMTSFSQPPADVERVMKAVLLLLGNTEKDVRNWSLIKKHFEKANQTALKERIRNFQVTHLTTAMKESVSEVLEPIGDKQVKSLIPGAAIFFDWCVSMLEHAEAY